MPTIYHDLKHPRKISQIADEKIAGYGSSGGVVWNALKTDTDGRLCGVGGLIPASHDYISASYSGVDIIEAVYRVGGSGGDIVATLNFTYNAGVLTSVTRI